jgi:hypothetical protein
MAEQQVGIQFGCPLNDLQGDGPWRDERAVIVNERHRVGRQRRHVQPQPSGQPRHVFDEQNAGVAMAQVGLVPLCHHLVLNDVGSVVFGFVAPGLGCVAHCLPAALASLPGIDAHPWHLQARW